MLSSDPESHPLESRIAPLVYELKRLEVFDPCWSCAGHNGTDGALWKIPRVVPTFSEGDNAGTTFSLEPGALEPGPPGPGAPSPPLAVLQRDLDTIAEHLREVAFDEARKLSRNAGSGAGG